MKNVIQISKHLTSAQFYDVLLSEVNCLKNVHNEECPIILDFSLTEKIEPHVIPNLLVLGKVIKGETGTRIVIRIPDTLRAEKLKFYLNEIGFLQIADGKIFNFEKTPYLGMSGKRIDPICGSLLFNKDMDREQIINGIIGYVSPFSDKYLDKYSEFLQEEELYINKIDHFLYEIVDNSRIHGNSDSFMTIQARYWDRKIYISVADAGVGFLNAWNEIHYDKDKAMLGIEKALLNGKKPRNELEAIICGVYKRSESKIYGLYSILKQTLELQGKIRIHSNDTQVMFTPRLMDSINERNLLHEQSFYQWNVRRQVYLKGVHIELEIPF